MAITELLVLQPHLGKASSTLLGMCAFGACLMTAPPHRPCEHIVVGWSPLPQQLQEPSNFGHRERDQVFALFLLERSPFFCAAPLTTVKNASATIARVIWRYQPCQFLTS